MNPAVTAAAIGVSGTVIVGVAGFGAAIWNNRRTITHARESRVWDRRADVYIGVLAALQYRMATTTTKPTEDPELVQAYLSRYQEPDWLGLEARLQAFGSEQVFRAMQASATAHRHAEYAIRAWKKVGENEDYQAAGRAAIKEVNAAVAADDVVIELIRTELQGRGGPMGDWSLEATRIRRPSQEPLGETERRAANHN